MWDAASSGSSVAVPTASVTRNWASYIVRKYDFR
jgi:hypothetical protein